MRPALDSRMNVQRNSLGEVFEVSALLTFASCKNVTISVWRSTPTAVALSRIDGYISKLVNKHPKFASVIVMESTDFSAPDQAARAEHGRLTKKYEDRTFGVAMIVDGNSARHSVYRFVMTTIQLLSAPTVTQKVFPSVGAAAGWIAGHGQADIERVDMIAGITDARALRA
jgi:hypothetical protein